MKPSDQAQVIAHQYLGKTHPEALLGIVSPCSTCLNQRSVVSADGRPFCPRRMAASFKRELDANSLDSSRFNLVVLTGAKQGEQDDGSKALANPVYDNASNSILVWAASLQDNGPTVGSDGNSLSPDILDPSFSSDLLQCKAHPFTPRDSEAQYFQKGALMEGDQVELFITSSQQVVAQSDGTSKGLALNGTVRKVNLFGQFPRQPLEKDLCVSGT